MYLVIANLSRFAYFLLGGEMGIDARLFFFGWKRPTRGDGMIVLRLLGLICGSN